MGRPVECNPCCEGGVVSSSSQFSTFGNCNINGCTVVPAFYNVAISGVQNSSPLNFPCLGSTNCPAFDGTHLIGFQQIDANCRWFGSVSATTVNCNTNIHTSFNIVLVQAGLNVRLSILGQPHGFAGATYQIAASSWSCLGSNTLSFVGGVSCGAQQCCSWPSTVSVSPA